MLAAISSLTNPTYQVSFMSGSVPNGWTFSRSTAAWNSKLESFGINVPIMEKDVNTGAVVGMAIRNTSTNGALWSRTYSDATWVKTSATATADSVGIDGASNAAYTLTATGANGTIAQSITATSATRTYSVFIKRKTGTGTVSISVDGTTFKDVTASLSTTLWYRAWITQATVVNPVITVKLATSGDAVIIDHSQQEASLVPTLPLVTTTVSVTGQKDVLATTSAVIGYNEAQGTIVLKYRRGSGDSGTSAVGVQVDDGTANNRFYVGRGNTAASFLYVLAGVNQANMSSGSIVENTNQTQIGIYNTNLFQLRDTSAANWATDDTTGTTFTGATTVRMCAVASGTTYDLVVRSLAYVNRAITKSEASYYL